MSDKNIDRHIKQLIMNVVQEAHSRAQNGIGLLNRILKKILAPLPPPIVALPSPLQCLNFVFNTVFKLSLILFRANTFVITEFGILHRLKMSFFISKAKANLKGTSCIKVKVNAFLCHK